MCRWLFAAVAVVVVAYMAPAHADALSDARKAVDASDYPTAKGMLDTALKAGTASPTELAEIYRLSGIVEAALGNAQGATVLFAKWLSLDTRASLPDGTSPKLKRPFDAAVTQAAKRGPIEAKAETEDDPPAVTLVIVNDPHKLIVGAKVYFRIDKRPEQQLAADGQDRIKIELETGKRLDLRLHGIDEYGNRVVELGSKSVPIVITSSGKTKVIIDPKDGDLVRKPLEPETPRSWYAQWWVWGIATGVAAGVGGFFAWRTHGDLQDLKSLNANSYVHPWADAQAAEISARRNLLVTNISAGVTGAFAIGTLILFLTRPTPRETETRAAITPIPGGGAVVLGGHF
jgi:hypothetical protein